MKSTTANVLVEVTDTGIGMDEETRRRCMEPFFTTKGERGTGLGLASVYGMLQRHNAELEIDSAPGKGTTVRMIFPVVTEREVGVRTAASHRRRPSAAQPEDPRGRRRPGVEPLLCSDALRQPIGHQLRPPGGQAGIDAFIGRTSAPITPSTLVITDLGMPRVDGRKVAEAIKALSPRHPSSC